MNKTFRTFESTEMVDTYIFGIPSGEVIFVTEDEIVSMKKERILKYDNKYRSFVFLDENKKFVTRHLFKSKDRLDFVKRFLKSIGINEDDYEIFENLSVDVYCDVDLSQRGLESIPIKFNLVEGNFDCSMNRLNSLVNAPDDVFGYFDCSFNKIKSLLGGPKSVRDGYYCNDNQIENLEGFPGYCGKAFDARKNKIITLKGCPEIIHCVDFDVSQNNLKDLKNGPRKVKNFNCSYNQITTLVDGVLVAKDFICTHNRLFDLLGMPRCDKIYYVAGNQIEEIDYD